MLKQLRRERTVLTEKMSAIAGTQRDAGVSMTDEEKRSFDDAAARVKEIDAETTRIEEARSLSVATAVEVHTDNEGEEFRSFLQGKETRSQTTTVNSAGGYTVGSSVASRIIESLKSTSGMIESASSISTATGNDLAYPTMDDTANEAVIAAETDARRSGPDVVFGSIPLKAFTYDSGIILISNELIADSAVNVETIVIKALTDRISRKLQKDFTIGDGVTEPSGVTTQSTLGITTASTTAVVADEILDLQYSVDDAYQLNGKYMMNSQTLLAVAKIKDGDGNYLINNAVTGMGKEIFGKKVIINNNMPNVGTGAKPILFGDFTQYMVRNVEGMNVFKFSEKYQDTNQVGFKASFRADGTLLNPNAIVHMLMA